VNDSNMKTISPLSDKTVEGQPPKMTLSEFFALAYMAQNGGSAPRSSTMTLNQWLDARIEILQSQIQETETTRAFMSTSYLNMPVEEIRKLRRLL